MRLIRLSFLSLLLAVTVAAAADDRGAWRWNLEERLARRFDAQAAQARYDRAVREGLIEASRMPTPASIIVGRHNPELFLPFELFPYLIRDGFHPDAAKRTATRDRWNRMIDSPAEFWSALETSLADFIANQKSEEQLLASLNAATSDEERQRVRGEIARVQSSQCELQHVALRNAAAAVGEEKLYRVLYEGIAPTVSTISREPELRSRLQFLARGCAVR